MCYREYFLIGLQVQEVNKAPCCRAGFAAVGLFPVCSGRLGWVFVSDTAPEVPLPHRCCLWLLPFAATPGMSLQRMDLQPSALGGVGGLPALLGLCPCRCVDQWGRQKVLSNKQIWSRHEINLGTAELGVRFGSCEGCSVHPWDSSPQKLPCEQWGDQEELREEKRGALLVPGLAGLPVTFAWSRATCASVATEQETRWF